jgi:hypothetical protein
MRNAVGTPQLDDLETVTSEVFAALQRRAMEVLALPAEEREGHYEMVRLAYAQSARNLGRHDSEIVGAKMEELTRHLVMVIAQSGGGSGGLA